MGGWDFAHLRKYGGLQDGGLASRLGWPDRSCPGRLERFLLVVLACAPLRWDILTDLTVAARRLCLIVGLPFSGSVQGRLPLADHSIPQESAPSQGRYKLSATWKLGTQHHSWSGGVSLG